MTPILILAAGQSTRMRGADKLLEDVDGEPLLRRQVRLSLATGEPTYVALPEQPDRRVRAIAGLPVTTLTIKNAAEGMSATLREAVDKLTISGAFMVVLADLAALETSDLKAVLNARKKHPEYLIWRGATQDSKPGHPILFDGRLRGAFSDLSGDTGAHSIVQANQDKTYLVTLPDDRARLDLDTPEDWAAWRARKR